MGWWVTGAIINQNQRETDVKTTQQGQPVGKMGEE
jgi:hypothetical protein